MRLYVLALVLVAACGEVSPAGNVTIDGSMAGASGAAGTTGSAGATGTAGTTGAGAGTGGASLPSCGIPLEQISGKDMAARFSSTGTDNRCVDQTRVVTVTNGVSDLIADPPWAMSSLAVSPSPPSQCYVELIYKRTTTICGSERLFVTFYIPAL